MQYPHIVILTGAGISAESGIKTFRATDGLWENHRLEDVATPEAFERDPALVQHFYNERRQQLLSPDIQANAAHRALAQLEAEHGGSVLLVTQNIDDLHERGGSQNLIHMHGELLKMHCTNTGQVYDIREDIYADMPLGTAIDRATQEPLPRLCECCSQAGTLRPHVVWFGEMPLQMDRIYAALAECDLFISIGTSGNVYPAAGFVEIAKQAGAHTIELNLEPSNVASAFAEHRTGLASETVPALVNSLLLQ